MTPFYFESKYRSAFLANMAARLRDVINDDCVEMLREKGIVTPISDVSLIMFISQNHWSSIVEMAKGLGYSHQRTASRVAVLEKLELISRVSDEKDSRCRRFSLTEKGIKDFALLESVYQSAAAVFDDIFEDIDDDLMEKLLSVVTSLKRFPVSQRIQAKLEEEKSDK